MNVFHQQILPVKNKIYRFALRITGSVQEAEDVMQDVLTKAWTVSEQPEATDIRNWEAWCMTLARHRSLDKNRYRSIRRTSDLETTYEGAWVAESPAHSLENQDLLENVQRIMQGLPEKFRSVLHLRDIEELSYEEIAQTLEISLDQVKTNLHRARKALKEQMTTLITEKI